MKRVFSIDEAVITFQTNLALLSNRDVKDYAWACTPLTSTKSRLTTFTPYLNYVGISQACSGTNIRVHFPDKHTVLVSFEPETLEAERSPSISVPRMTDDACNWYQQTMQEVANVKSERNDLLTKLQQRENQHVFDQASISKYHQDNLYYLNQINGLEQQLVKERALVDELKDQKDALEQLLEQKDISSLTETKQSGHDACLYHLKKAARTILKTLKEPAFTNNFEVRAVQYRTICREMNNLK